MTRRISADVGSRISSLFVQTIGGARFRDCKRRLLAEIGAVKQGFDNDKTSSDAEKKKIVPFLDPREVASIFDASHSATSAPFLSLFRLLDVTTAPGVTAVNRELNRTLDDMMQAGKMKVHESRIQYQLKIEQRNAPGGRTSLDWAWWNDKGIRPSSPPSSRLDASLSTGKSVQDCANALRSAQYRTKYPDRYMCVLGPLEFALCVEALNSDVDPVDVLRHACLSEMGGRNLRVLHLDFLSTNTVWLVPDNQGSLAVVQCTDGKCTITCSSTAAADLSLSHCIAEVLLATRLFQGQVISHMEVDEKGLDNAAWLRFFNSTILGLGEPVVSSDRDTVNGLNRAYALNRHNPGDFTPIMAAVGVNESDVNYGFVGAAPYPVNATDQLRSMGIQWAPDKNFLLDSSYEYVCMVERNHHVVYIADFLCAQTGASNLVVDNGARLFCRRTKTMNLPLVMKKLEDKVARTVLYVGDRELKSAAQVFETDADLAEAIERSLQDTSGKGSRASVSSSSSGSVSSSSGGGGRRAPEPEAKTFSKPAAANAPAFSKPAAASTPVVTKPKTKAVPKATSTLTLPPDAPITTVEELMARVALIQKTNRVANKMSDATASEENVKYQTEADPLKKLMAMYAFIEKLVGTVMGPGGTRDDAGRLLWALRDASAVKLDRSISRSDLLKLRWWRRLNWTPDKWEEMEFPRGDPRRVTWKRCVRYFTHFNNKTIIVGSVVPKNAIYKTQKWWLLEDYLDDLVFQHSAGGKTRVKSADLIKMIPTDKPPSAKIIGEINDRIRELRETRAGQQADIQELKTFEQAFAKISDPVGKVIQEGAVAADAGDVVQIDDFEDEL